MPSSALQIVKTSTTRTLTLHNAMRAGLKIQIKKYYLFLHIYIQTKDLDYFCLEGQFWNWMETYINIIRQFIITQLRT